MNNSVIETIILVKNEMDRSISKIMFGGGCFWCTEAVFQRLNGVVKVESGYSAGKIKNPSYREVCSGLTGHNEVILVDYNSAIITLEQLLGVFFTSHDPTTLNRQGNDVGTQYRSGIYYFEEDQNKVIKEYIDSEAKQLWNDPIVTEVKAAEEFYPAEEYHRDYYNENSHQAYCQVIINPKLSKLRSKYKELLKDER